MKKALSLILIVSMLLSAILSFAAFADDDTVTIDGMIFSLYSDSCSLEGFEENLSGDIVIPAEIKIGTEIYTLYPHIDSRPFWNGNDKITSITFPDVQGLRITPYEIYGSQGSYISSFKSLKRVVMGKGNEISTWVFTNCTSIEEIVIPEGVETVYLNAFNGCTSLKEINIPASVNNIVPGFYESRKRYANNLAMNNCSAHINIDENNPYYVYIDGVIYSKDMTELVYYSNYAPENYTVPSGVEKISEEAFFGCENLKTVSISETVAEIGIMAFAECTNLESIQVDGNNQNYTSVDGVLFSKDMKTLVYYPNAKQGYYYEVPDTVTTVDHYAFSNHSNIKAVGAPDDVSVDVVHSKSILSLELYTVPGYYGYMYPMYCRNAKNVIIPTSITSLAVGEGGNSLGPDLETVYYMGTEEQWQKLFVVEYEEPDSDISNANIVYNYKFKRGDCTGDGEIDNKDVVTTFRFCSGTDVNAIIKAMNVNGDSYVDNKDVVSLFRTVSSGQIPKKDEPKKNEAEETEPKPTPDEYFEFTLLEDDTYEIKAKDVNNMPENVVIPEKHEGKAVTVIGERAFEDCRSLVNVTIPDNITSICICAFNGCTNLKYNKYDNAGYLGNANNPYHALVDSWDPSRTSIDINEKTKIIAAHAFLDNTNIKGITIPDGVISIDDGAFDYCCHLTNVTIPDSVTYISSSAFVYCTLISVIKYKGTYNQWISVSDDIKWEPGVIDYLTIYCSDGNYTMQENKL